MNAEIAPFKTIMSTPITQLLAGQVAIISGAVGDIGSAIVLELARLGADIAVGDIVEAEKAAPLLEQIQNLGRKARYDRVDVADENAVKTWIGEAEADLGVLSLIIPTAAIVTLAGPREISSSDWNRELAVNLTGAFHMAQAGALRLLHHKESGRIVFVGSWVGHAPQPNIMAYCVSKAGMRMMCRCMARDLAPEGILVNEVAPGNVDAGVTAKIWETRPEEREWSANQIPIRQNNMADDVAFQVAYLCDPRNTQVTGTTVIMDGGLSLLSYRAKGV